jgi:hypothetical protein
VRRDPCEGGGPRTNDLDRPLAQVQAVKPGAKRDADRHTGQHEVDQVLLLEGLRLERLRPAPAGDYLAATGCPPARGQEQGVWRQQCVRVLMHGCPGSRTGCRLWPLECGASTGVKCWRALSLPTCQRVGGGAGAGLTGVGGVSGISTSSTAPPFMPLTPAGAATPRLRALQVPTRHAEAALPDNLAPVRTRAAYNQLETVALQQAPPSGCPRSLQSWCAPSSPAILQEPFPRMLDQLVLISTCGGRRCAGRLCTSRALTRELAGCGAAPTCRP